MISQLTGLVADKYGSSVVLDVAGVGYEIELTLGMLFNLPDNGNQVTICTHFVVREDAMLLYGFQNSSERSLFRQLIKISGIGPKVAIGILSSVSPGNLVSAVKSGNSLMLTQIPGIGKKTAERLVIELRDKLNEWMDDDGADLPTPENQSKSSLQKESESALVALGYKANDAAALVSNILKSNMDKELSVQEVIRQSLRSAVK